MIGLQSGEEVNKVKHKQEPVEELHKQLPESVLFGVGRRTELRRLISGTRVVVFCSSRGREQMEGDSILANALEQAHEVRFEDVVESYPNTYQIRESVENLRGYPTDVFVGFGGGSSIDFSKTLSLLLSPSGVAMDLSEALSGSRRDSGMASPIVAIPTTAGTGSEVTSFATIWDNSAGTKHSLSHVCMKPMFAIVDPELSYSAPHSVTLETGLDALNQALETVWNKNSTHSSLEYAASAFRLLLPALTSIVDGRDSVGVRRDLSLGATFSGLAIDISKTSICHSISYPLTARFGLPHGLACAFTMSAVMKYVALHEGPLVKNFVKRVGLVGVDELLRLLDGLLHGARVRELCIEHMPSEDRVLQLVPQMQTPGRSDNFVSEVDDELLVRIIKASFA